MKRLAHALIAVATGIEQATMVWESLKLQSLEPAEPVEPRRHIGFNPAQSQENSDPRDFFARES